MNWRRTWKEYHKGKLPFDLNFPRSYKKTIFIYDDCIATFDWLVNYASSYKTTSNMIGLKPSQVSYVLFL